MRILVTMKHVPDTTEVRFGGDGALMLRHAPTKINDYDRNALEAAASIRESGGTEVIVVSVGPPEAAKTLKEALAYGADAGILVTGSWSEALDSASVAKVLAAVIEREGPFDLVLSGDVSEDGYDSLVPGLLAASRGVPYVRGVTSLGVIEGGVEVIRTLDDAEETIRVALPAGLSVTRLVNVPRTITTMQVMKVPMSRVRTVSVADLGIDEGTLALDARPVQLLGVRPASNERRNELLEGEPDEVVAALVSRLSELGVLA